MLVLFSQVGKLLGLRADRAVLVPDWPLCELAGERDVDASDLAVGDVVKVVRGAKVWEEYLLLVLVFGVCCCCYFWLVVAVMMGVGVCVGVGIAAAVVDTVWVILAMHRPG